MGSETINALIVDDDPKSRRILYQYLQEFSGITITGSVSSAGEALESVLENQPDIVFLDIEMPGKNGFDFLTDLRKLNISPCIIFQTAYEQYAVEAIKNAAFDYLLKPLSKDELSAALARYRSRDKKHELAVRIDSLLSHFNLHRKIRFNTRSGFIMIDKSQIIYCLADWSYTELHLETGKREIVSMNIGKVEKLLDETAFFRLNRSVIIRRDSVHSVDRKKKQCIISYNGGTAEFRIPGGRIREMDRWLAE